MLRRGFGFGRVFRKVSATDGVRNGKNLLPSEKPIVRILNPAPQTKIILPAAKRGRRAATYIFSLIVTKVQGPYDIFPREIGF